MHFTVLIPVYNTDPNYIHACLNSVLNQTLPPDEILIIDDGSKNENTCEFLHSIHLLMDKRLKVLFMKKNSGISSALNEGIIHARHDWIVRMDSDDIMMPNRIERQAYHLKKSNIDLLGSQMMNFGNYISFTNHPLIINKNLAASHPNGWFLNHPTVVFNKKTILNVGGYDPNFDGCEDLELWYRLLSKGVKIENMSDVLLLYRRHNNQASSKPSKLNLNLFKSYLNHKFDQEEKPRFKFETQLP